MSNINANATVTLTVNGKQAQDMLDGLKKKSVDLEKAIEKAAKAGNKADLKKLQKELKQTNRQIQQIESATVGVEKVLKKLDKATPKELNKTLSTLKKQLNGIERGTTEWNRQCDAIKKVKHEIDRVNADLRESEGRWSRFNRIINDWQTTIMGAAAAVTGLVMAGRSAVKAYADMDAEMANVRKFTGMTAEQVQDLNEEFKKMNTRTSREDLNKLAEEAGRLGKTSKEDVLGFVKAADQINVALDDLGEGATLTLSKLTNIFGDEKRLGTEKALLSVGSVINELSQNCTASAPYLANFAQRMAGVGAQAKMTIPEIMGFAAVLDSQGQAVEMSATALQKLVMDMFKDTDKIIKATGMNAKAFKDVLAKDTNEALIMLLERLHELGNIDVLAPVFKDMGENGARASSVIAALAGNIETVKWEQEEANKAFQEATSVTKEFDVQNNTVQAGLDKAAKRVKEIAVQLGEQLAPVMRHVISSTTLLLKAMSATITFFVKYKAEIITATAVLAAYTVAVNLATIKTKLAAAATLLWNAAVKTMNILLPIGQVLLNGMKLAFERLVWQTRGANATQQAYNKSLLALKNNAMAAKTAYGLLAVAIAAVAIAIVRYIKAQQTEAQIQRMMNDLKKDAIQKAAEERTKIENLVAAAKNEALSLRERQAAVNALNRIIPGYNAQLDATSGKYRANKAALDKYIESLVHMYEVMGAKEKLKELGKEKAELRIEQSEAQADLDKARRDRGTSAIVPGMGTYYSTTNRDIGYYQSRVDNVTGRIKGVEQKEAAITKAYGADIQKQEVREANEPQTDVASVPVATGSAGSGGGSGNTGTTHEERFKAEKEWKAREEALNRIAYATGKENYEQYTEAMLAIEEGYHKKILERTDLTEQEKLDAQVGYYEAQKKAKDESQKQSAAEEEAFYNEAVALQKQRYIDGQTNQKVYEDTLQILELQHLKRMVNLYEEGSKERLQAERTYQDRLLADMQKRQQEVEQKEKEHQQRLAELKKEYFGLNAGEKLKEFTQELEGLKEVFDNEIKTAGNNESEKSRIEKAYEEAKKILKGKYGIEDDDKNWLEKAEDDVKKWLDGPGERWREAFEKLSEGMNSIFSQMTSLINAETEIQIAAIDKRYEHEISKAEGNNYKIKKLEKKKQEEEAKLKNEANKKLFSMQVIQAIAQTAQGAVNAFSSAAAIPWIGWKIAPIAASMAIAAGMLQVAAIKKQQQASAAQGYAEGGFTGKGKKYEPAGIVHKGEWVASQALVNSPVARPMIDALDYAQRTNTIGSLGYSSGGYVGQGGGAGSGITSSNDMTFVMNLLVQRLNEPFVTVNTVTGDTGIKKAQDDYEKLMRNKTPKSRRK